MPYKERPRNPSPQRFTHPKDQHELMRNVEAELPIPDQKAVKKWHRRDSQTHGFDKITNARYRARIAALWADDVSYAEIAVRVSEEFGLEQPITKDAILYHVKKLIDYWQRASLWSVDRKMAMIQARWAQLEEIAENALFASMEGKSMKGFSKEMQRARANGNKKEIKKRTDDKYAQEIKDNGQPTLTGTDEFEDTLITMSEKINSFERFENTPGDPRWMAHLISINKARADLWNLKELANTESDDEGLARLSDDERDSRLTAVIRGALTRAGKVEHNLAPPSSMGIIRDETNETEYVPAQEEDDTPDEAYNKQDFFQLEDEDDFFASMEF